jgi:hypothetical protein
VGAVDLRRPPSRGFIGALRAAIRRGQTVPPVRDRRAATGNDRANTGSTNRPDATGQDPDDGPKTIQQWFNTAAFVQQAQFAYGSAVRNSITGPGIFNFDMSILRNFRLPRNTGLQLRLEAFNTFNQPVWQDPNTSVTSPQYGTINSTRKPMRELQLGVKFTF